MSMKIALQQRCNETSNLVLCRELASNEDAGRKFGLQALPIMPIRLIAATNVVIYSFDGK